MRLSYEAGELGDDDTLADPTAQFARWFADAAGLGHVEANAMTLATVDGRGRPSARIVLLKEFDERGLVWYTNYDSRKGRELAANPNAALLFHWQPLERQVRVEGVVEPVSAAESDAYFAVRPLGSRLGAWASPQSEPVDSREALAQAYDEAAARHGQNPPRPQHWGGFRLVPEAWEFWQGRPSRLHDRIRYRRDAGQWVRQRLAP